VTEVRPWLEADDAPTHLRDLLREAQASQPLDARTQARSRRRIIAMSALPAAAGVVFWVKSVALGAVLGGAVVVATYAPSLRPTVVKPDATVHQSARGSTSAHRSVALAPDAGVEQGGAAPTPVPTVTAPLRSGVAALPSAQPSQLLLETRLLERARGLMGTNARQALMFLDAHQREFPHGALEIERELMAVDALLKLGLRQDAQLRAAQLRARAPGSIYEQRLARLLGDQEP
jgi:hypothetical protein